MVSKRRSGNPPPAEGRRLPAAVGIVQYALPITESSQEAYRSERDR